MPQFDLDLPDLRAYRPTVAEPDDFADFWSGTLAQSRERWAAPRLVRVDARMPLLDVYDVSLSGFQGEEVRGWLLRPARADGPLPAVLTYRGYGGGRGQPVEHAGWAAAGYAHLVMDTRGQGSGWSSGATADPHGSGPAYPGSMTRGIHDPLAYYYRRVFTDAALGVDAARSIPWIDETRVVVAGESQGGGIALAAAALCEGLAAALIDVPFLCHFERAIRLAAEGPYLELVAFLGAHRDAGDDVARTLSYFDGVNMAKRVTAPVLFSVALMDLICPPSTVFAAFNSISSSSREIVTYPFNGHEGGRPDHWAIQAGFLANAI